MAGAGELPGVFSPPDGEGAIGEGGEAVADGPGLIGVGSTIEGAGADMGGGEDAIGGGVMGAIGGGVMVAIGGGVMVAIGGGVIVADGGIVGDIAGGNWAMEDVRRASEMVKRSMERERAMRKRVKLCWEAGSCREIVCGEDRRRWIDESDEADVYRKGKGVVGEASVWKFGATGHNGWHVDGGIFVVEQLLQVPSIH